ncbi:MAG: transposase [Synergistaceae bacterium]|nr:transposase [Synergistaceae bacterium]
MKSVPKHKVSEVMRLVKTIHAQEGIKSARQKAAQVVQKLQEMKLSKAAKIVESGADETFSYYSFPPQHWQHIRTNNLLERLNKEIRRRTRVVGSFPDAESAIMLISARLRHIMGSKWGAVRYMNMALLAENEAESETEVA